MSATIYKWVSALTAEDVMTNLELATDRKKLWWDGWSFNCKYTDRDHYDFKLSHRGYFYRSPTYRHPIIKGTIEQTSDGCIILAKIIKEKMNWMTIFLIAILYFSCGMCLYMTITESDLMFLFTLGAAFIAATILLVWHLSTRKQSNREMPYIKIINTAAKTDGVIFTGQ